jgi:Double-GTPase 1
LFVKKISQLSNINNKPNLTILLTCWDIPKLSEGVKPSQELNSRLPMLYNYLKNTWDEDSLTILGLSSTSKNLTDEPDEEYIDKTPIKFGYIINSEGIKEDDITLSIDRFIGKK